MIVTGRLFSNGEVRSLAEIKKKVSPKIQTAIKTASKYVRDIAWEKEEVSAARLQHILQGERNLLQ